LLSLRFLPDRVVISVVYRNAASTRSETLWTRSLERPPGKTLAECVEAAVWRASRACADGLLVPEGWDSL
jgi:hypothetical protein